MLNMSLIQIFVLLTTLLHFVLTKDAPSGEKLRLCIVETKGSYKRTEKFCPILESTSNIECIVGVDRLDCVRRIHKGFAHFGVFSSEDLVAARWATVEILVTNEMRFHDSPFEYEIVAVVDNEAGIHTAQDLRGSRFCHPGHGLEGHWTDILANYFESVLVPKSCDPDLSITEARIKASSNFFGSSCKAGPWVPDTAQDRLLKLKYPSLCELCYDPYRCGIGDKHWGRRGTLYCLTTATGDVAWARLDDVRSHFGFSGIQAEANPNEYSFLCPEGHLQPLNTSHPCVWVAKPWPVIAARRSHASLVQEIVSKVSHDGEVWQNALLSLLETYHVDIVSLDTTVPIDDYLDQAIGFQSAYSFPECNPPRSIVYCTTSIIQHVKCSWLQEAAQVYGIEPNIQCIRAESVDNCLDDAKHKVVDVVHVSQDHRITAQRDYGLVPVLYEYSQEFHDRYVTVAVVRKSSGFQNFTDLEWKKACFPSFEGAAYLSALDTIAKTTPEPLSIARFFSYDSCTWNPKARNNCPLKYTGDEGALRCLVEGGDVAFVNAEIYKNFTNGLLNVTWSKSANKDSFKTLCPYGANNKKLKYNLCYLHWTSRGHLMTHNSTVMRQNEIHNSLRDMDRLFGKKYKSHTLPFTMFGPFDKRSDVMFRDNTDGLRSISDLKRDEVPRLMEYVYHKYVNNMYSSSSNAFLNGILLASSFLITFVCM